MLSACVRSYVGGGVVADLAARLGAIAVPARYEIASICSSVEIFLTPVLAKRIEGQCSSSFILSAVGVTSPACSPRWLRLPRN